MADGQEAVLTARPALYWWEDTSVGLQGFATGWGL